MVHYTHDYTKASEAQNWLFLALENLRNGHTYEAKRDLMKARQLLDEYLAADNMVEDADVEYGFIKQTDTFDDDQLDLIRDLFLDYLVAHPKSSFADELLEVINVCQRQTHLDEFESVEQLLNNNSGSWAEISRSAQ